MWVTLIAIFVFTWPALAQTAECNPSITPVSYVISLADPASHLLHVSMIMQPVPAQDLATTAVALPVWNALYQVRDFSQFIRTVSAKDVNGKAVPVRALDKTTWSVPNATTVEYTIIADSPGPFGAQLTSEHAFFNLAEILIYPVGRRNRSVSVLFTNVPRTWRIATALNGYPGSEWVSKDRPGAPPPCEAPEIFVAANYDQLVDSPVELGTFHASEFEENGTKYRIVIDGDPADYNMAAVAAIARKVAATEVEWMQDRPFDHYVFFYHFRRPAGGGGMEHAYSTAIDASAERVKRDPASIASVTAHEFFHLWNVKRIRPQSLEPVDYTKEQYTRALWFSEGVTSTVADFMLVRAGLMDEKKYLESLAASIRTLELRPARLTQSVEESSLEAWLEKYPSYSQPERSISYYNKGQIVGVLLDLAVREASGGKASLRDIFQWMNRHYAKQGKFFPDSAGVQEAAEAVSGAKFGDFFARYIGGVDPLPYDQLFATVGLRLDKSRKTVPSLGFRTSRNYRQPPSVTSVEVGSDAEKAGVRAGDVVEEFNGKAAVGPLQPLLAGLHPGNTVHLKLSGAGGTRDVQLKLGGREEDDFALVESEHTTAPQRARRAAWIRGDSQP